MSKDVIQVREVIVVTKSAAEVVRGVLGTGDPHNGADIRHRRRRGVDIAGVRLTFSGIEGMTVIAFVKEKRFGNVRRKGLRRKNGDKKQGDDAEKENRGEK
jgi:hypothetical protein